MTPTPPEKRPSSDVATPSPKALTVEQQRELKRQEKLAEYRKQLAKRRRGKVVWWIVGSTAAVAVVGLIVASIVLTPPPPKAYEAGSEGVDIEGVDTFENVADHVEGTVDYEQSPPTGGPHNAVWLNCGTYSEPVPSENAVHSMEHGAIWVTYDAGRLSGEELTALKAQLPSSYAILSPYEGLQSPVVLSSWNHQLKLESADDERIGQFFEEYWRSQNAPEPNAACTGAYDAPGKQ